MSETASHFLTALYLLIFFAILTAVVYGARHKILGGFRNRYKSSKTELVTLDTPEARLALRIKEKREFERDQEIAKQKAAAEREERDLEEMVQSSGIRAKLIGTSFEKVKFTAYRLWRSHEERKRQQESMYADRRGPQTDLLFALNAWLPDRNGETEVKTFTVEELIKLIEFEKAHAPKVNVIQFTRPVVEQPKKEGRRGFNLNPFFKSK